MEICKKIKLIVMGLPIIFIWGTFSAAAAPSPNVNFPDIKFPYKGKSVFLSEYRGKSPVLIMKINPESAAFSRIRIDFDNGIAYLEKNQIKHLIILPSEPKTKVDYPWFADTKKELDAFLNLPEYKPFSAIVLDAGGNVALTDYHTNSSHLDIPRIMQLYSRKQSLDKEAMSIDYTQYPPAPNIDAVDIHGKPFRLFEQRGKAVLLVFFSITCSHCRHEMPTLVEISRRSDVTVVAVCSLGEIREIEAFVKEYNITFPVIKDSDRTIFSRYSSLSTPDSFIVDKSGLITYHHPGMSSDVPYILQVELDKALGISDPQRLTPGVYLGARACRSCHEKEYNDWLATPHSIAYYSLNKELPILKKDFSGAELVQDLIDKKVLAQDNHFPEQVKFVDINNENQLWQTINNLKLNNVAGEIVSRWKASRGYTNPDCQKCHVTGFQKTGGFFSTAGQKHLINIQCEVCHGMAGGHKGNAIKGKEAQKAVCLGCHTEKYSLKFSFDEAYKLMSHAGNIDLSGYSEEMRQKLIRRWAGEQTTKARLNVAYVGSAACRDCHKSQYQAWEKTRHAAAFNTLKNKQKEKDDVCLRCHTTGYGLTGGFNSETDQGAASVGCEVCHGPGADHIKAQGEDLKRTIFGLAKKCKYCVIENICTACHDKANSPKFNIESYLTKVKH